MHIQINRLRYSYSLLDFMVSGKPLLRIILNQVADFNEYNSRRLNNNKKITLD